MPNPYGVPEITPREVEAKRERSDTFVWLDVRERFELQQAAIADERIAVTPLSELAQRQLDALPAAALDRDAEIIVMCHHGIRSAQVVVWLQQQGWRNVLNLAGGIEAWAHDVDLSVGVY
jgi:rhodanese-related sulfurtransferase